MEDRPVNIRVEWPRHTLRVKTRGVLSWGDFLAIAAAVALGNMLFIFWLAYWFARAFERAVEIEAASRAAGAG